MLLFSILRMHLILAFGLGYFTSNPNPKQMSIQDRFQILMKIAALLREELPLWAGIEAQQTGRPVREMRVLGQLLILRLNWDDCRNGLSIMRLWCELMKAALCHLREM